MLFKKNPDKKYDNLLKRDVGKHWKKAEIMLNDDDCCICLFDNVNPKNIPNKMIAGINKHTGGIAYGHKSIDEVVNRLKNDQNHPG